MAGLFQLTLELSNVFPIQTVATAAASEIFTLARNLRLSGSDLVVEEDLAMIFGRGSISDALEKAFKLAVNVQSFTPLSHGCPIVLELGPGPTMNNALKDRRYLATMITLSMLAYFHDREQLASMITTSMLRRFELKVEGSSPDPGIEGVMNTLAACSSQCNAFHWSVYRAEIEARLRQSNPKYQFGSPFMEISHSLLLGAMDYLYIVQRWPEERKVTVSNERGCIPLVIWAHYLLDLVVTIHNAPGGDVVFGQGRPQIYINWSNRGRHRKMMEEPIIRLLDREMSVILESSPEPGHRDWIRCEERHPLAGYGTISLQRFFNKETITEDGDVIYQEAVNFITALVIHISNKVYRSSAPYDSTISGQKIFIEKWRILVSAKVVFQGLSIHKGDVELHTTNLVSYSSSEASFPWPPSLKSFFESDQARSSVTDMFKEFNHIVQVVFAFAHVHDVERCAQIPLLLSFLSPYNEARNLGLVTIQGICNPDEKEVIYSDDHFAAINCLLTPTYDRADTTKSFLTSDFGWSIFFGTLKNTDPGAVRPELIHVQEGTPVNQQTGERKYRIDDVNIRFSSNYANIEPSSEGSECIPRSFARYTNRAEYWTSRPRSFELTVYLTFEPSGEWRDLGKSSKPAPEFCLKCRSLQEHLWQTIFTPSCKHLNMGQELNTLPMRLISGETAVFGWRDPSESERQSARVRGTGSGSTGGPEQDDETEQSSATESHSDSESYAGPEEPSTQPSQDDGVAESKPNRIWVGLTYNEPQLRWLAIHGQTERQPDRGTILRTQSCCPACALEYTRSLLGKWYLIL